MFPNKVDKADKLEEILLFSIFCYLERKVSDKCSIHDAPNRTLCHLMDIRLPRSD